MERHGKILSAIFFILGVSGALGWLMAGNLTGYALLPLISIVLHILAGFSLHNGKSSAKPLGIIVSLLNLFSFPIGTALGIYGLWYFVYVHENN